MVTASFQSVLRHCISVDPIRARAFSRTIAGGRLDGSGEHDAHGGRREGQGREELHRRTNTSGGLLAAASVVHLGLCYDLPFGMGLWRFRRGARVVKAGLVGGLSRRHPLNKRSAAVLGAPWTGRLTLRGTALFDQQHEGGASIPPKKGWRRHALLSRAIESQAPNQSRQHANTTSASQKAFSLGASCVRLPPATNRVRQCAHTTSVFGRSHEPLSTLFSQRTAHVRTCV